MPFQNFCLSRDHVYLQGEARHEGSGPRKLQFDGNQDVHKSASDTSKWVLFSDYRHAANEQSNCQ